MLPDHKILIALLKSGEKTLNCVQMLSEKGYLTTLGVSNISFGMPNREAINSSFLGAAIARGLSAAIINPSSESMKLVLADENPSRDFVFDKENPAINESIGQKKDFLLCNQLLEEL